MPDITGRTKSTISFFDDAGRRPTPRLDITWEISLISLRPSMTRSWKSSPLAQRQLHDDGGALGPRQGPHVVFSQPAFALFVMDENGCAAECGMIASASSGCAFTTSPTLFHRRLIDLAFDAADVDLRDRRLARSLASRRHRRHRPCRARARPPHHRRRVGDLCWLRRGAADREHAIDQRTGDEQADQKRGDAHDGRFDNLEPIGGVQSTATAWQQVTSPTSISGERHVGDFGPGRAGPRP